jgi:hypothetical protein
MSWTAGNAAPRGHVRTGDGIVPDAADQLEEEPTVSYETEQRLQALSDEYIAAVNAAVAEDRPDILDRLVDEYPDAALRVLTDAS